MTTAVHEPLRPEEPDTYMTDPVRAEYVAYAEKPYRDEAAALGHMAARAQTVAQTGTTDGEHGRYKKHYAENLQIAGNQGLDLAASVGEEAGEAYDQYLAAKNKLDGLTGGSAQEGDPKARS